MNDVSTLALQFQSWKGWPVIIPAQIVLNDSPC